MKRISVNELPKWMRKHPRTARLYAVAFLFAMPFVVPVIAIWEFRDDIVKAWWQATATAFLPWEKSDD